MTEEKPIRWAADVHAENRRIKAEDAAALLSRVAVMTMGDDRDGAVPPHDVIRAVDAVLEALREDKKRAKRILDIGCDCYVGSVSYSEFAVIEQDGTYYLQPSLKVALQKATASGCRAVIRWVGDWPDGTRWTRPWKDITREEYPIAFTNDKEHSD